MNSFGARATLTSGGQNYEIYRLGVLDQEKLDRLPFSLKILLENLLRNEDGTTVTRDDIDAVLNWNPKATPSQEIAYRPARVLMQDFTGVPAVVDLAAMREAMKAMGGDPNRINPLQAAELVIDHSVQVDRFASPDALQFNTELEYMRNRERYQFLKWGQKAFDNFKVVPPETGIVHQVNIEYLARVVFQLEKGGVKQAYPDTLVGTDSHTTMVNGLGVLGWGVGGIEAEAAMLGQPISMLVPQVIGFKLTGKLPEGTTTTDLVLTVTEILRQKGVVGKFVEFFGQGLSELALADRATLANMAPEFGSTCGMFPIDKETLTYLRLTGREESDIELVEAYAKEQGLFRTDATPDPVYTDTLELDISTVEPSLAGPKRPQDRVPLKDAKKRFLAVVAQTAAAGGGTTVAASDGVSLHMDGGQQTLRDGSVVIAAITSCTNTSNPAVMMAAGLVAKKAVAKGLQARPWVKTSLAPGSKVVTEYLGKSGLLEYLDMIGFNLVGYGCTTCIGNSGPLPQEVSDAIEEGDLTVASVLSGNRNFEGRVHPEVRTNYLASPPLVVAYALTGRMDMNLLTDSIGTDLEGEPVYLKDIWPTQAEVQEAIESTINSEMFRKTYADVFQGASRWASLEANDTELYKWEPDSTYIRLPPFFSEMAAEPAPIADIQGARALALLGDSITTDHISPAGVIKEDTPAGQWLLSEGVKKTDFNSYGSRRGNHEVMMRGTFANVRLRNQLAPGIEGGWTQHLPDGEQMPIYDASMKYQAAGTPLVILGGKEYGSGSSRDWAAKGTDLLGVKAVLVESYERIHRSNLIGMGVVPLQFLAGESVEKLGLTGREQFDITGLEGGEAKQVTVRATSDNGADPIEFQVSVRIDTPQEVEYYKNGGILQYVLRQILKS
jgi:aconitate hydratase